MEKLGAYCDEFLIHAVDVEGKAKGIEVSLAKLLGEYNGHPVTYAGGVGSMGGYPDPQNGSRRKSGCDGRKCPGSVRWHHTI